MLTTALDLLSQGISVIATDNTKRSLFPWKKYQSELITPEDITSHLKHPNAAGIAVICGAVSGNLEVIDADLKYDSSSTLWDRYMAALPEELKAKLYIVSTRSAGYHIYYRCEVIAGNQKLAMRHCTDDERKSNPNLTQQVLMETRGEGGYVIAPPTEGYTLLTSSTIPVLTIDERDLLLDTARSFNEVIEEERQRHTAGSYSGFAKTPWDDYNERGDVLALLEQHGWTVGRRQADRTFLTRPGYTDGRVSADFHHGLNLFKVFTTSSQFETGRGYKPSGVYCVLEAHGDYAMSAKMLRDRGYGKDARYLPPKAKAILDEHYKNGGNANTAPVELVKKGMCNSIDEAKDMVESHKSQHGNVLLTFWEVNQTKAGKQIVIVRRKLEDWLYKEGFHLYFYNQAGDYRLVRTHRIEGNDAFCEEVTVEYIKKHIKNYILSQEQPVFDGITKDELLEVLYKGADQYLGKGMLEFLDSKSPKFLRGSVTANYIPFHNCVVKITKDGPEQITYHQAGGTVWKRDVIDFDVKVDDGFDFDKCEYYQFLSLICGNDADKLNYCLHLIGYLLHHFKDPSRPYAVILAEETDDEKLGGGTGKGIFVKALSHIVNLERVDGKNFKLDKNFAFQRVGLDTRIVAIEDVRKNVDFEGFYPIITEGMTVEKKNKDELFIEYKDSPKILFTTNYTISQTGNHARRRQRVLEFSPYFSATHTPMDEFHHKLFDDWTHDEWDRFYNLMFTCVSVYLANGLQEQPNTDKLKRKHIRLKYGEDFLDWFEAYAATSFSTWKLSSDLWHDFLNTNEIDKKDFSQTKFGRALAEAAELFGRKLEKQRCKEANNKLQIKLS